MKKITKGELPHELSPEVMEILVNMALEFPKTTFDWAEISEILEERNQLMLVLDKVEERKKVIEQAKEDGKSDEQKQKEKEEKMKRRKEEEEERKKKEKVKDEELEQQLFAEIFEMEKESEEVIKRLITKSEQTMSVSEREFY